MIKVKVTVEHRDYSDFDKAFDNALSTINECKENTKKSTEIVRLTAEEKVCAICEELEPLCKMYKRVYDEFGLNETSIFARVSSGALVRIYVDGTFAFFGVYKYDDADSLKRNMMSDSYMTGSDGMITKWNDYGIADYLYNKICKKLSDRVKHYKGVMDNEKGREIAILND